MTGIFIRERDKGSDQETHRKEGYVTKETEIE